jgi:hypothetical protein
MTTATELSAATAAKTNAETTLRAAIGRDPDARNTETLPMSLAELVDDTYGDLLVGSNPRARAQYVLRTALVDRGKRDRELPVHGLGR